MPTLTIAIGGNGAGKTTWCRRHRHELPNHFYNADTIAEGLGDWNSPRAQREARQLVDNRVRGHLANEDLGFESTYSGNSRPGIATEAKRLGYRTHAILIGTEDASINAARVAAGTGHQVLRSEDPPALEGGAGQPRPHNAPDHAHPRRPPGDRGDACAGMGRKACLAHHGHLRHRRRTKPGERGNRPYSVRTGHTTPARARSHRR